MQRPHWDYCSHYYVRNKRCAIYRDDGLGVQMQIIVKNDWTFIPPREHQYFYIDGVEKVYRSEEKLLRALDSRARHHSSSLANGTGVGL
jgi:hypothetical protein